MKKIDFQDPRIAVVIAVVILAGTLIFVMSLFNGTKTETEVLVNEGEVIFKGQYGITVKTTNISEVRLEDSIPAIGRKVNGAGLGDIKKGNFEVEGLGTCRLFIHSASGPYVVLKADGKYIILNFEDPEHTREVYEELKEFDPNQAE